MKSPTRRELLRQAGALAVGAGLGRLASDVPAARAAETATTLPALGTLPSTTLIDPQAKSVVAHVERKEVVSGARVHEALMGEMFEDGLRLLSGARRPADGWHKLLNLKSDDVLGIKFNQVGCDELGTTIPFAMQLVASLIKAQIDPARIVLIEAPPRLTRDLKTRPCPPGFSGEAVSFGSGAEELAAVLQDVTAIINVPFLKTHNIAGMTSCLKNLSHALIRRPGKYHANACTPYVGDIVALPQIHSKLRLHIVNALRVVFKGGPAVDPEGTWTHAGLLMSTDPVAADATGMDLINERRAQAKLPRIGDEEFHIAHVHAAAQRGLGTDDPDYIQILKPAPL